MSPTLPPLTGLYLPAWRLDPYAAQAPERCSRRSRKGRGQMGIGVRKFRDTSSTFRFPTTAGQSHTRVRKHITLYAFGRRCIGRGLGAVVFSKISPKQMRSVTVHFCRKYRACPRHLVRLDRAPILGVPTTRRPILYYPPWNKMRITLSTLTPLPLQKTLAKCFTWGHNTLETIFAGREGSKK